MANKVYLPVQHFTPDEASLPEVPMPPMVQSRFKARHNIDPLADASLALHQASAVKLPTSQPDQKPVILDGFKLLTACGVEFPDFAHRGVAAELGLTEIVSEDLGFFTLLSSLDVGRNALKSLVPLAALPALQELKAPCNGIIEPLSGLQAPQSDAGIPSSSEVDTLGFGQMMAFGGEQPKESLAVHFHRLTVLDLSYNLIRDPTAVAALAEAMPLLADLDLTCNGLSELPSPHAMAQFKCLRRLVLERNGLRDTSVVAQSNAEGTGFGSAGNIFATPMGIETKTTLACVAACPCLEELQLGHNYLTGVPPLSLLMEELTGLATPENQKDTSGVPPWSSLSTLGLSYNFIGSEAALIEGVSHMPRLTTLVLYGNPMLGPHGEDPTGASIADLAAATFHARDGISALGLDVLTELPRKPSERRRQKPGEPGSADPSRRAAADARRSSYRAVTLRTDGEGPNSKLPSAAQFRSAGHAALLERHASNRRQPPRRRPPPKAPVEEEDEDEEDGGDPTRTFLTGVDPGRPKGRHLHPPPPAPVRSAPYAAPEAALRLGHGNNDAQAHGSSNLPVAARVPPAVFAAALARPAPADPAALRSALVGLRHMLKNPLTHAQDPAEQALMMGPSNDAANALGLSANASYNGPNALASSKGSSVAPQRRLDRPTATTRARAVPKQNAEPYVAPPLPLELAPPPLPADLAQTGAGGDQASTRRGTAGAAIGAGRGVPSTSGLSAALGRRAAASRMLEAIEADLDAMYNNRSDEPENADAD